MQIPEELLKDLGYEVLTEHGVDLSQVTCEGRRNNDCKNIILRAPVSKEEAATINADYEQRLLEEFNTSSSSPQLGIRSGLNAN